MPYAPIPFSLNLNTLQGEYEAGKLSPRKLVESLIPALRDYPDPAVWIHLVPRDELLARSEAVEARQRSGEKLSLYGVPFAVKDNIDVSGIPTTAACPAYSYVPEQSAPVVHAILDAGAILIGKTNLDQFGSGLAGDRSPYGACRNVFDPQYISGGSSSGSAVAVAAGLTSFALGTDTAGSGRVPAACNNIVGLKPTPGALSSRGLVPACSSLDCVSIFALTAADAFHVFQTAQATAGSDGSAKHSSASFSMRRFHFAVPRAEDLEFLGDTAQAQLFDDAIARLERLGGRVVRFDYTPFQEVASLLYEGPWLAERLAGVEAFVSAHADELHPATRTILEGGRRYSAVEAFRAADELEKLARVCLKVFEQAELLLVPTFPTLPRLAAVQADSLGWGRRLGRYTNFVNLLRLAALALPAGFTPRGLPGGITLIAPGGSERALCELGTVWQRSTDLSLGATTHSLPTAEAPADGMPGPAPEGTVRVAVAGAHLSGQPLHADLRRWGARLVRACRTASLYRFVGLMELNPPRPGLLRDAKRAGGVEVEVYDLPYEGFGKLVASVAPPLAIGTVELADGEKVKGFLCESFAAERACDITDFGGWIAFRDQENKLARTKTA